MEAVEKPAFETESRKRLYEYVERHGTAKRHMLLRELSLPPDEFREELESLKSKGYLAEDGGTLSIDLRIGEVEEYNTTALTFIVRPARHEDFEDLVDTIRDVTAEETYVIAETVAEQLLYEDAVTRHNTVESRIFFVATVDDELVGWTHLDLPQNDHVQETAQQTVGVRRDHWGHGIGSALLQRGLDWAEANGYRKVYNSIPMTNERAIQFLDDQEWDTEAIRREHYTIDGEYIDEIMMAYRF